MTTPRDAAQRLVIAYAFTPYADTSAIVAAKRVLARAEPVDVIQNELSAMRDQDAGLDALVTPLIRRRAVVPSQSRFGSWRAIAEFCERGTELVAEWERDGAEYHSMYSRAHFTASHVLAALIKIDRPAIVWEAEFSDPLSRNAVGAERRSVSIPTPLRAELAAGLRQAGFAAPDSDNEFVWAERVTLALADRLMFTNEHQRDYIVDIYADDPELQQRVRAVAEIAPHPVPSPELYERAVPDYPLPEGVVNIGYFGNFYASQHPAAVLRAVAAIGASDRKNIKLHLFVGDVDELQGLVADLGIADAVAVNGRLPYLDFLAVAKRMDVLLAFDAAEVDGRTPVLLSKWSDYVGTGVPVWGIVAERSALDAADLSYRSPLGHTTAAMQVLTQISRELASGSEDD